MRYLFMQALLKSFWQILQNDNRKVIILFLSARFLKGWGYISYFHAKRDLHKLIALFISVERIFGKIWLPLLEYQIVETSF